MSKATCPYLGTLDADDKPGPAVSYPSFENQCYAVRSDNPLLLADQATFCLSGGHRHCMRFQFAQQTLAGEPAEVAPGAERMEPASHTQLAETPDLATNEINAESTFMGAGWQRGEPEEPSLPVPGDPLFHEEGSATNHRWAWAGAVIIFISLLLCGGVVAAYTGWQIVNANYLVDRDDGRIVTVNSNNVPESAPTLVYLVVTVASVAQTPQQPVSTELPVAEAPLLQQEAGPTAITIFPQAVTPTAAPADGLGQMAPIAANPLTVAGDLNAGLQQPAPGDPPDVSLPTPAIDLQLEVPTRRPTPVYDIPTSTPVPLEPIATETPTPVLGTPVVVFEPLEHTLMEDECTLVRWHVENVRAVYYENQGVDGIGQKEECMDDKAQTYTLAVILGDGSTRIYTTTIDYLAPTPTPTPTPSFTPDKPFEPTPTWTPDVPTSTPTPIAVYAVSLEIFGDSQHTCNAGSTCEFDLLVINRGNTPDSIAISLVQSGQWPTLFCADSGSCSSANLTLAEVAPGDTKLVTLKVNIASDAAGQAAGYSVQAISIGSSGGVASGVVALEVAVP